MTTNQKLQIEDDMIKMGFSVSNKGFDMIVDAVGILLEDPTIKFMALYQKVADLHESTASRVERNIRTSVQRFYSHSYQIPPYLLPVVGVDYSLNNKEFLLRMAREYSITFSKRAKLI